MPKLIIQQQDKEWTVELQEGPNVIGRSSKCEVPVGDTNISREHCEVVLQAGVATLVDKGSMNGTLLNGARVFERKLEVGDKIQVGQTVLWFEAKKGEPVAAKGPPSPGDSKVETRRMKAPESKPASSPSNPAVAGPKKSEVKRTAAALVKDYAAWGKPGFNFLRLLPAVAGIVIIAVIVFFVGRMFGGPSAPPEDKDNLLADQAGFESLASGKPAAWALRPAGTSTCSVTEAVARGGKKSLEISKSDTPAETVVDAEFSQKIPLAEFGTVEASAWAKWGSFGGTAAIKVSWYSKSQVLFEEYSDPRMKSGDWAEIRGSFAAPPGADGFKVAVSAIGRGGQIHFDDVRVVGKPGGALSRRAAGSFGVAIARGGAFLLEAKRRLILSNVHVRLENDREAMMPQTVSVANVDAEAQRLKITGSIPHPVRGEPVRYELSLYHDRENEVTIAYEFDTKDLAQVDRLVVFAGAPGASPPNKPVVRWEFSVDSDVYSVDYAEEIRVSRRDGGRIAQEFDPVDQGGKVRAAIRLRMLSDREDRRDPRAAARKVMNDRPSKALEILRAARADAGIDEAMSREISGMIRDLEQREQGDWREVEAKSLVAELLGSAPLVEAAVAQLEKYEGRWSGDPFEAKSRGLRERLAASPADGAVADRGRRMLEKAKQYADEGRRALAEMILIGLVAAFPGTETGEEARKLLNRIRSGG